MSRVSLPWSKCSVSLRSSTRILGVGMSRVSLTCIICSRLQETSTRILESGMSLMSSTLGICSKAQMTLSRMSQSGTYAKSKQPLTMAMMTRSLTPANQTLIWYPTLTENALLALPVPSLAPESTYRAKTLAGL